ncbi:hypothetical protein BKH43_02775 [Helicobacter sp. 13S00401-1]|uniref:dethiobiotin synthase n=1 Tax=Helicobacter sp. 13S00401-1 TaxID=1905758 RepID=UPI000BA54D1B|nr:dethiobiotin synthase [Helicobacter sp. 13S00401-1]PAF51146.1 hypothetical protein BKH43_02775 [Helicobacter sp. 13S00401-1]
MTSIFFGATNTDIGKTYSMLQTFKILNSKGIKAFMLKPLESGYNLNDKEALKQSDCYKILDASGLKDLNEVNYMMFKLGASIYTCDANFNLEAFKDWMSSKLIGLEQNGYEVVLCEGAGGLLSPLTLSYFWSDFAKEFCAKLVLVASDKLGEINNILLNEKLLNNLDMDYKIYLNLRDEVRFDMLNARFLKDYFEAKDTLSRNLEDVSRWMLNKN